MARLVAVSAVKEALGADTAAKKKVTLKLKKPVPRPSIAGNWKESDATSTLGPHPQYRPGPGEAPPPDSRL